MRRKKAALLVSVLLLALTVAAVQSISRKDVSLLREFIEGANSAGIIEDTQFKSLNDYVSVFSTEKSSKDVPQEVESEEERKSTFMRLYDHLTLLNVLYFSGALLVMGAYTLFMTLAFEKSDYGGLSLILMIQAVALGVAGIWTWSKSEDYQLVGGLLCTISTSMVPFTVYNIQRSLGLWPKKDPGVFQGFQVWIRPGWVVMEIATVIVGLGFLWSVRFPFLLFPVAFCLWYLSMDLAPLYPNFDRLPYHEAFEIRRRVSLAFGAGMILVGYLLEKSLGSHPDFGFWLYLFGLISLATAMACHLPRDDLFGSVFLLVNLGFVLMGSHLNRTTFYVFGTLGVIEYTIVLINLRIKVSNSVLLWLLKALTAAALFSQAVRRDGNFEILGGLVCVLAFNFNALTLLPSGELYAVILLFTNLGLVAVTNLFTRPLYLWLFTLPGDMFPVSLICSLSVAMFHASLLIKYLPSPPYTLSGYVYSVYRIAASVVVSFTFVCLRQPHFAWIGGLGIPIVAYCFSLGHQLNTRRQPGGNSSTTLATANIFSFLVLLFGISFSIFLQSNLLYLICCVSMVTLTLSLLSKWKVLGCVFSVALVLLSVPLQSKFMITIGAMYLFLYLSYLAFDVFKNSLLFPLALIFLGLSVIYAGVQYQQREQFIQEQYNNWTPSSLQNILNQNIDSFWEPLGKYDWYHTLSKTTFELDNFLHMPAKWLLWSGAVTFALVHGSLPLVSYICLVGIALLVVVYGLVEVRNSLMEHLDESVIIDEVRCTLSTDPAHESHGMIIRVKGTKPKQLDQPVHLALDIGGTGFWHTASILFSEMLVSFAKTMFLPYKLTPHLISFIGFKRGSTTFSASIHIATGHKGTKRAKHSTLTSAVDKFAGRNVQMQCIVLYSNSFYKPWSKLCIKSISFDEMKRQLNTQAS